MYNSNILESHPHDTVAGYGHATVLRAIITRQDISGSRIRRLVGLHAPGTCRFRNSEVHVSLRHLYSASYSPKLCNSRHKRVHHQSTPPCNMLANTCAALGVHQPIGNRLYTDISSLPIIYAISVRVLYAKHLCPEAWYIAVPTDRTRAGFRDQALSL